MTNYRVYEKGNNKTFFERRTNGNWFCTHGAWEGKHVDNEDGTCALDVEFKVIQFDSYRDLTDEQYDKEMYEGYL